VPVRARFPFVREKASELLAARLKRSAETSFPHRRVSLHLGAGAITGAFFLASCLILKLTGLCPSPWFALGAHAFATSGVLVAWIVVARRFAPDRWVGWIERGAVLTSLVAYSAMSLSLEQRYFPDEILLLIACAALLGRSIAVPVRASDSLALVGASAVFVVGAIAIRSPNLVSISVAGAWLGTIGALAAAVSWLAWNLRGEIAKAERAGAYVLEERIHASESAAVFRARHALLDRPAAVKVLAHHDASGAGADRFTRAARMMARLSHPHATRVYDYGQSVEGSFYVAMELVDGIDLERALDLDPSMPPERVIHIARQIGGVLSEAHELGLLHGGLSPRHVMLTRQGGEDDVVKVLDFGSAPSSLFSAPEAAIGPDAIDARADVYSVGAIAMHLLGGRPVPEPLRELLARATDLDPDRRPSSARSLTSQLAAIGRDHPWTRDDATRWWRHNDAAMRLEIDPVRA
jgi:hypothetical protein